MDNHITIKKNEKDKTNLKQNFNSLKRNYYSQNYVKEEELQSVVTQKSRIRANVTY